MACIDQSCGDCGHLWATNEMQTHCPKCGCSDNISTFFDEDDYIEEDDDFDWEEWEEEFEDEEREDDDES